jgi:hypothetical protein
MGLTGSALGSIADKLENALRCPTSMPGGLLIFHGSGKGNWSFAATRRSGAFCGQTAISGPALGPVRQGK